MELKIAGLQRTDQRETALRALIDLALQYQNW